MDELSQSSREMIDIARYFTQYNHYPFEIEKKVVFGKVQLVYFQSVPLEDFKDL